MATATLSESEIKSRQRNSIRWIVVILSLIAFLLLAVEIGTRLFVPRISHIESRIEREHSELLRSPTSSRPLVAVLGNSLLDSALQFDNVSQSLADTAEVRRYVIERTTYRDWEFGLPRLFDEGMRPNAVVLMLSPEQLMADSVRGDFFASRMMRARDLPEVTGILHLHPTNASGMAFANISKFYGMRAEIRQVILGKLMPELPKLTGMLVPRPGPKLTSEQVRAGTRVRLRRLAELCRSHGVSFALALAPLGGKIENSMIVDAEARAAGIQVIRAFNPYELTSSDFTDGFHLSEASSERVFTPRFIAVMRTELPKLIASGPRAGTGHSHRRQFR